MPKPIIAVPADIRHFTGADWHAAQNQYVSAALKVAGVMSFIIPAFEDGNEVDAILDRVDGLLVSGSATNVHPSLYGKKRRRATARSIRLATPPACRSSAAPSSAVFRCWPSAAAFRN